MTVQSKKNGKTRPFSSNAVLEATSFLSGNNAAFIEGLYEQYLADPNSVDGTWRGFFQALNDGQPVELPSLAWRSPAAEGRLVPGGVATEADAQFSIRAIQLVRSYRVIGHREADDSIADERGIDAGPLLE